MTTNLSNTSQSLLSNLSLPPTTSIPPSTSQNTSNHSHHRNLITISTLNVRGLSCKAKLSEHTKSITNERSILCCSETKSSISNPLPKTSNNTIIIPSLPNSSTSSGACIILTKSLATHIFNTFSTDEFWCAIHLKFKPKVDIVVISCYLPHDRDLRKTAVISVKNFIKAHHNKHLIMAGDFNSYHNLSPSINAPSHPHKRVIYKY